MGDVSSLQCGVTALILAADKEQDDTKMSRDGCLFLLSRDNGWPGQVCQTSPLGPAHHQSADLTDKISLPQASGMCCVLQWLSFFWKYFKNRVESNHRVNVKDKYLCFRQQRTRGKERRMFFFLPSWCWWRCEKQLQLEAAGCWVDKIEIHEMWKISTRHKITQSCGSYQAASSQVQRI